MRFELVNRVYRERADRIVPAFLASLEEIRIRVHEESLLELDAIYRLEDKDVEARYNELREE
jgi:hypothetical protein